MTRILCGDYRNTLFWFGQIGQSPGLYLSRYICIFIQHLTSEQAVHSGSIVPSSFWNLEWYQNVRYRCLLRLVTWPSVWVWGLFIILS